MCLSFCSTVSSEERPHSYCHGYAVPGHVVCSWSSEWHSAAVSRHLLAPRTGKFSHADGSRNHTDDLQHHWPVSLHLLLRSGQSLHYKQDVEASMAKVSVVPCKVWAIFKLWRSNKPIRMFSCFRAQTAVINCINSSFFPFCMSVFLSVLLMLCGRIHSCLHNFSLPNNSSLLWYPIRSKSFLPAFLYFVPRRPQIYPKLVLREWIRTDFSIDWFAPHCIGQPLVISSRFKLRPEWQQMKAGATDLSLSVNRQRKVSQLNPLASRVPLEMNRVSPYSGCHRRLPMDCSSLTR